MAIRLGGERSPAVGLPQLPVIPLAGSTRQPFRPDLGRGQRRQLARQQLGIDADAFVVAFVGRLSFHSKAHPQVLYQALQAFAESADVSVTLVECGHHFNSEIAEAYRDLQRHFPRVQFMLVGGLTPASEGQKWQVLAAADVFSSPADNLQETFGLSLLEAMAAELPLVVSDWDGYRDLVDHGHNGLLVPTSDVLPRFTQADDLDHAYATQQIDYDLMVGLRSCGVVIDRHALTAAFAQLHADPRRRLQMGKAGLEVLEQRFSEAAVTDLYRALWADLAERRALAGEQPQNVGELPALQPSQAKIFGHYATTTLDCTKVRADAASLAAGLVLNSMNRGLMQQLVGAKLDEVIRELREAGQLDLKQLQNLGLSPQRGRRVLAALLKLGLAEKAE
ncbi:MAG: glycosyltransferase family 4 protein [Cyanobacteriota bacterium]|nr:glycosyltransferase family 4 protein [Cyanobacteriota bacterium]